MRTWSALCTFAAILCACVPASLSPALSPTARPPTPQPATPLLATPLSVSTSVLATAPVPTTPPLALAEVEFKDSPAGMEWMKDYAGQSGVDLFFWGLQALDSNTVFLYGGLRVPPGTLRSVLLRSDDGGRRWKEVMEPEHASDIVDLALLEEGGIGWALALWTVEGPGPASVYKTSNRGQDWEKLVDLPALSPPHSAFVSLEFSDAQHGEAKANRIDTPVCCATFTTSDGGLTWQEVGECSTSETCFFDAPDKVTAPDGGQWRRAVVGEYPRQTIEISLRRSGADAWVLVSTIPVHYRYEDGRLIPELPTATAGK